MLSVVLYSSLSKSGQCINWATVIAVFSVVIQKVHTICSTIEQDNVGERKL